MPGRLRPTQKAGARHSTGFFAPARCLPARQRSRRDVMIGGMPCTTFSLHPQDIDPRRWERCRRDAAAAMVAAGWTRHARKFYEVMIRRARRLWAAP